jgi:NAD(P)-dependent dehydrogenase (short-subunit alcohol dehydrogenase family)
MRGAADKVRPPGSLVFMSGTGARRPRAGLGIASTATVAFPTLIANLALELAPIRVNLIAAGFVDTTREPETSRSSACPRMRRPASVRRPMLRGAMSSMPNRSNLRA